MIRVCFVSSFPPSRGRLAEYAYYLVDELKGSQEISRLDIITDTQNRRATIRVDDKITLHRIWKQDGLLSVACMPFRILRLKPDVVHFNLHMAVFGHSRLVNFVGLSLPFLCRLIGFKTLVTLHNLTEKINVEKTGFKDTATNRFGAFIATKLLSMSSAVTLTVKSYVGAFRRRYKCKNVLWIPHGTGKITYTNGGHRVSNSETILYFGHSGPYKDLELLLKTFKVVERRNNGIKLVIAGDSHPNYPGFLEQFRSGNDFHNVEFRGYVPEHGLRSLFQEANVVVLPYHTCTGTSGVAHLASSFGTPMVATDLPEFRELAEEGCGLLLAPHCPDALADKIEEIIDNPGLTVKLKERNLQFARRRSWDIIASSFCTLYKELLTNEKNEHPSHHA